jgi:DNA-binding beta-propeller fold protein YncE
MIAHASGWKVRLGLMVVGLVFGFALVTATARAADRVFWTDEGLKSVSSANLDGSGAGANLATTGATAPSEPSGTTVDIAAGKIFWVDQFSNKVSFANLDGSGGGDLNTTGATVNAPEGVAFDPATGKVYWANEHGAAPISFANVDGSGGGDLNVTGATPSEPSGLAIDVSAGKVYWANFGNNTISFANLNNSGGGGQLNLTGATANGPAGVAIDPVAGKLYWTNFNNSTISFAALDGSGGGGQLSSGSATIKNPWGLAIDRAAGRLYWANFTGGGISFTSLVGGTAGDLSVAPLAPTESDFPSLLKAPTNTAPPTVSGGSTPGSQLSCSQGSWAPDQLGSYVYQSARSFAFSWTLNGAPVPGASSSSITASSPGSYVCQVTAVNQAGSTVIASAAHTTSKPPAPNTAPNTKITKAVISSSKGKARFAFRAIGTHTGFKCALVKKAKRHHTSKRHHKASKPSYRPCRSPKSYSGLMPGRYRFSVRASNAGVTDRTPATRSFRIR